MLVRLHQRMCLGRIGRGKGAVNDGLDGSRRQQRPDLLAQGLGDRRLESHRARAQRGAGDHQALAQHQRGVELGLHATLHGNDDDAPILGQALHLARHIGAGDHVQHHIHATPLGDALNLGHEVLRLVVDGMVRAQRQTGGAFFVAARGDDDGGAARTRQLYRRDAYAAAAPLHQQGLACLQAGAVEDIAPHGEEGLGQRGRLDVGQASGNRQALRHRGHAIFGIAATSHQRADAIAHSEAGRGQGRRVTRLDDARDLQPRQVRGTGRRCVMPLALQHIGAIDTAGRHADEQLAHPRQRHWALAQTQHLRRTKGRDFYRLHCQFTA